MTTFQAYRLYDEKNSIKDEMKTLSLKDLPSSDVLIKVKYSSLNYKDALATREDNPIIEKYPITPGIDLAGEVVKSRSPRFNEGDRVIATSYEIGVSHDGGFSEYASIPEEWIVPLPEGLTLKESMIYGTAGFTAALSIHRLEQAGLTPDQGPILVTGASGGVGSIAVAMLAKRGYAVKASTGNPEDNKEYLKKLGANEVLSRKDIYNGEIKPLARERFAGAVDPVGGEPSASILSQLQYEGSVALSGLTGGAKISTNVYPFILRGISLIGIDSVNCPMETRKRVWLRMANDLKIKECFDEIENLLSLDEVPERLQDLLNNQKRGRMVVKL
ncbi:acryloyl-CoA reductase [Halobacillus yeomjeoni]|uniref:Acryloyl-CoA reductase n=1 Tax=Halobacillus yeomjeoni TaxID=311194 RepID=A0A931HXI5_9BACI|nr:acryloyl-CoA reductase [Halobacillus yeomjeoni]MBH0231234.1 acryloyl-CoA reductase [Halobacillus yeomjeoni]